MENQIYDRLFEIADSNMQRSGKRFTCPKAAFLYYIKNDPYETDIMELMETEASNEEFTDLAYTAVLNRPADDAARCAWRKHTHLPETSFRQLMLSELLASEEAGLTGKVIHGYAGNSSHKSSSGFRQRLMQKLLPVYRKMPEGVKRIVRKVTGAGEL